jgi:aminopeptidase N
MNRKNHKWLLFFIVSIVGLSFSGCQVPRGTPLEVPTQTATASPTHTASKVPSFTASPTVLRAAEIGAAGIGDPYFPDMGNGGYDVQHYDLDLAVDMMQSRVSATVEISARALQDLGRFDLDLTGFTVTSVEVDGRDAGFERKRNELVITPAVVITGGSLFTVDIKYRGMPGNGTQNDSGKYVEGWNFYPGGVIVAGEPTGAETWYPDNNHPRDKATYAFHITVAEPFIVAANGVLRGRTDRGDGTWTYDWVMDEPMASYLATIAISNFTLMQNTSGSGVPVRNYVDADIPPKVVQPLEVLPAALDFFSSIFGAYPFDVCGVVVHEYPLNFSLENQTLIVFGDTFLDEMVVVHELSHQWFGDSVSLSDWKDIWLNEGFASYAETLWLEHTKGNRALREDLSARYRYAALLPVFRAVLIGDPGPHHLFDQLVYDRGALTLHALRLKVGDDAFFRILRGYFERYRNGNATTVDFISVAEETSGQDLGEFFHAWLYSYPLPDIPELNLSTADLQG